MEYLRQNNGENVKFIAVAVISHSKDYAVILLDILFWYLYGKSREKWLQFGYLKQKKKTEQLTHLT